MNGINIIIVFVGLLGFLPLIVFLYNKKRTDRILTTGRSIMATVYYIQPGYKRNYEIVYYHFWAMDGNQYKGRLTTKPGVHHVNNTIEVFYLPNNPKENTVKGTWNTNWFLLFVVLIAMAVVYMMYKLYEMVNAGNR